ncbi:MAG: DUF445 domain-containing protein [Janthinobacterium lividum]
MNRTTQNNKLKKMKALATGLLIAVTGLLVLAKSQHDLGAWAWVSAFAEAAMVGALADWFAVVALFRRPLGLPIPHTAILPRNKARVADALAEFVRDKFLGTDALLAKLPAIDPAQRLADWMAAPANARLMSDRVADMSGELLRLIDDARVKAVVFRMLEQRLTKLDLSGVISQLLDILTEDKRHQLLLNEGIRRLSGWLDNGDVQKLFADRIVAVAGTEYPKMIGALGFIGINPEELGLKLAVALVKGFNRWLHDIGDNPDHERRQAFDDTVQSFIDRLKTDTAFRERVEKAKTDLLSHPATRDYVGGLWDSLRARLEGELARPDSTLRAKMAEGFAKFGTRLVASPSFRDSLNEHFGSAIRSLAPSIRDTIARHIADTVREWDDEAIAREVESSVGSDLQFIRLNGTVVGGLVGVAIHAVLLAF